MPSHTSDICPSRSACQPVPPHLRGCDSSVWSSVFQHESMITRESDRAVYLILLVQTARAQSYSILSLIVHQFRCRRVLLGFRSPACCLPPFAIQRSLHEASCEAEAGLLSSVSHWRQSFQALAKELDRFLSTPVGISQQSERPWCAGRRKYFQENIYYVG